MRRTGIRNQDVKLGTEYRTRSVIPGPIGRGTRRVRAVEWTTREEPRYTFNKGRTKVNVKYLVLALLDEETGESLDRTAVRKANETLAQTWEAWTESQAKRQARNDVVAEAKAKLVTPLLTLLGDPGKIDWRSAHAPDWSVGASTPYGKDEVRVSLTISNPATLNELAEILRRVADDG